MIIRLLPEMFSYCLISDITLQLKSHHACLSKTNNQEYSDNTMVMHGQDTGLTLAMCTFFVRVKTFLVRYVFYMLVHTLLFSNLIVIVFGCLHFSTSFL